MSFTNTQLPCELPVFKDKVMYINTTDSAYKMEQSYVISASYKGILRLSPNNYNTIYENNPVELTVAEDQALSFSYSDAIVFDKEAIIKPGEETLASKVNADIGYRMIIGSDSDGYLVNFRISDESIEFDKLGVIGITKTKKVTIYSDCHFSDSQALTIGNTIMPSLPNEKENSRADLLEALSKHESRNTPEDWDEIEIDIKGDGDNSYLLSGYRDKNGMRTFKYSRSHQFIKNIIKETLLSIQSVPTGSVHWLPVTFELYKALVNKAQYPNQYYRKDIDGQDTTFATDPIIRDYLICDGRKYPTKDFPELAKILWKEEITYWDINGKIQKHKNGGTTKTVELDGKVTEKYDDYFRVPDLRTKFISYVYAKPATDALSLEPDKLQEYKNNEHNIVGSYTPDNSPYYKNGKKGESHFHFSAYGSYNGFNYQNTNTLGEMYHFKGYLENTDLVTTKISPRIWYLGNTTGDVRKGSSGSQDGNSDPGWGYGFGSAGGRRRWCKTADYAPANAFLSAPDGGHSIHTIDPTLGLCSKSKLNYKIPTSNEETYTITEHESFDNDYYPLETSISHTNTVSRYGHENAPKCYTFLPLIKI